MILDALNRHTERVAPSDHSSYPLPPVAEDEDPQRGLGDINDEPSTLGHREAPSEEQLKHKQLIDEGYQKLEDDRLAFQKERLQQLEKHVLDEEKLSAMDQQLKKQQFDVEESRQLLQKQCELLHQERLACNARQREEEENLKRQRLELDILKAELGNENRQVNDDRNELELKLSQLVALEERLGKQRNLDEEKVRLQEELIHRKEDELKQQQRAVEEAYDKIDSQRAQLQAERQQWENDRNQNQGRLTSVDTYIYE